MGVFVSALQVLVLEDNTLSGNLPSSWGAKGSFTSIQAFNLASNNLTGEQGCDRTAAHRAPEAKPLSLAAPLDCACPTCLQAQPVVSSTLSLFNLRVGLCSARHLP
jgi:hypothetical protein